MLSPGFALIYSKLEKLCITVVVVGAAVAIVHNMNKPKNIVLNNISFFMKIIP
jgi:hypothetical protein